MADGHIRQIDALEAEIDGLELEIKELRALIDKKDDKIEDLESIVDGQGGEIDELNELVKKIDDPDLIIAAETLVDGLKDRDPRVRNMVVNAMQTGVTSDLWQVL